MRETGRSAMVTGRELNREFLVALRTRALKRRAWFRVPDSVKRMQVNRKLRLNRFVPVAFLIPLGIRAVPEVIAGPYPIGFDTVSSYMPAMKDYASGNFASIDGLFGGPLILVLLGIVHSATGIDPLLILKITGPMLHGFLGVSEYFFARSVLKWDQRTSLLLTFVASTYFVSLRVSWDLFRNSLGLAIFLIALGLRQNLGTRLRVFAFSGLVWLVTTIHLLVATVMLSVLFVETIRLDGSKYKTGLSLVPGVVTYCFLVWQVYSQGVLFLTVATPSIKQTSEYLYPFYIFLPLLPMAWFGRRLLMDRYVTSWLAVCILGLVLGTTPLSISSELVRPSRWTLMMSLPVAIWATNGYNRPRGELSIHMNRSQFMRRLWIVTVLLLGISYAVLPASTAFPYFRWFTPTSMLQSSVPLEDSGSLVNALGWLSTNIQPSGVLVTHHAMYGWAREYFRSGSPVIVYGQETRVADALQHTLAAGYTVIYTVWWTNGSGWYGEPSVPDGFALVHEEGRIGVFLYDISSNLGFSEHPLHGYGGLRDSHHTA